MPGVVCFALPPRITLHTRASQGSVAVDPLTNLTNNYSLWSSDFFCFLSTTLPKIYSTHSLHLALPCLPCTFFYYLPSHIYLYLLPFTSFPLPNCHPLPFFSLVTHFFLTLLYLNLAHIFFYLFFILTLPKNYLPNCHPLPFFPLH